MKTSVKKFLPVVLCVLCVLISMVTLIACNPTETEEKVTLTLDAGDGVLNQTALEVSKDSDLLKAVGDIAPKADGLIFDCWLLDGEAVKAGDKATKDLTLTAQYKTSYKVEVFYQNADKSNYEQDETKTVSGFGKVGDTVSPTVAKIDGFVLNNELSSDASKTLVAGENILKYYYARSEYSIQYINLLDDGEEKVSFETYNGAIATIIECDFERDGYEFIGWSNDLIVGAQDEYKAGNKINISGDVVLYAQWGKVYNEAYRSGDKVAIAEVECEDDTFIAKLITAQGITMGVYDTQTKFFTAGEIKGQIDDESGFFLYDVTGLYLGYSLLGAKSDEAYGTLSLNMATGEAVYKVGSSEINGTYQEIRLTNGAFSGEKQFVSEDYEFYFCFLDSSENPDLDTDKYAGEFFQRGEEAGEYVVIDMTGGNLATPYVYNVELDGYGGLTFPIPSFMGIANAYGTYYGFDEAKGEWKYEYEGQLFEDTVGEYPREFVFKVGYLKSIIGSYSETDGVITVDGETLTEIPILVIYNENLAGTYETKAGAKFEMDGYGNATYISATDAEPIEGYVEYKGMSSQKTESGNMDWGEYWDATTALKSFNFIYYNDNGDELNLVFLCQDYHYIERESWLIGSPIVKEEESHSLISADGAKEAGCYIKSHGEEKNIEFKLDGRGSAELSLYDKNNKTNIWFASGEYDMTSENEGEFTLTSATGSLAYMGVAAGSFKFRLSANGANEFEICDETLLGEFDMQGDTVVFDGYGALVDNDEKYTYEKLGNNVLMAKDKLGNVVMYTVNCNAKTVSKSQSDALVGDYLTVVQDNALYIGPGRLVFDGNGRALFYEMANGEFIGEGLYTYDRETNRGTFITTGDMQFYVESFDFCITTMVDSDGILCNVYIKYDVDTDVVLTDENGNTLTLDGFGFATYNDGENEFTSKYELTEYMFLGTKLTFVETGDIFSIDIEKESFAKEEAYGIYNAVYFDEEAGAYMISEDSLLYLYGIGMESMADYFEFGDYDMCEYSVADSDNELILTFYIDDDVVELTVKLVLLPAFDDFGDQYYVETFLIYDENMVAEYTDVESGATIEIDGYGDATYTDGDNNVYQVPFYNVSITNDMITLNIDDENFENPSHMLVANVNVDNRTFTTAKEIGTYVRYMDGNFYYPMLNLYGMIEQNYVFELFRPYTDADGNEIMLTYAIGTYEEVQGADGRFEYVLKITAKNGEYYNAIAHLVNANDTLKVKLVYVDNDNGAYSSYILCDENAEGEYIFEETTFALDGFGTVTTTAGKVGVAERVGDYLIIEIEGERSYFKVGADNLLTETDSVTYIEWIK